MAPTGMLKVLKREPSTKAWPLRRQRTIVRRSSQSLFKEPNQTAIVLDFDDTLFPATFVDHASGLHPSEPLEKQTHIRQDDLKDILEKIEECQVIAESLLLSAQSLGHVIIVTLCTRGLFKRRAENWYPRVWKKISNSQIKILYARECPLNKEHSAKQGTQVPSAPAVAQGNDELSTGYWAWVKGTVIEQELTNFYSQYKGQSWKNVISIGDSNIERYGMLGASNAHVQKCFGGTEFSQKHAYVKMWEQFDNDMDPLKWSEGLEGVHEGHIFKVRTKVVKFVESPTPDQLVQQMTLLLLWLPSVICSDGCLNLLMDDLNESTIKQLEKTLMIEGTINGDPAIKIEGTIFSPASADKSEFTKVMPTAQQLEVVEVVNL